MATFSDLVLAAQPALLAGGCAATVQEGATWLFEFSCKGSDGTDIDMTGVTGTVTVKDGATVVSTITWTITGSLGTLILKAAPTTGLAVGAPGTGKKYTWDFKITNGTDTAQVWSGWNSFLIVIPALP